MAFSWAYGFSMYFPFVSVFLAVSTWRMPRFAYSSKSKSKQFYVYTLLYSVMNGFVGPIDLHPVEPFI